jgi:hypothetical protein
MIRILIQGSFGAIQGTFGMIQGTFGVIPMMMTTISPFGQLGLWAPSSGVDPRRIHSNHVCLTHAPFIEETEHPHYGQEALVVCRRIPQGDRRR